MKIEIQSGSDTEMILVKIYLKDYKNETDLMEGLKQWFNHYTHQRPHQGLGRRTPYEVYHGIKLR